jgi:hypothetical protein
MAAIESGARPPLSVWPCGTPFGNTQEGPDGLRSAPVTERVYEERNSMTGDSDPDWKDREDFIDNGERKSWLTRRVSASARPLTAVCNGLEGCGMQRSGRVYAMKLVVEV